MKPVYVLLAGLAVAIAAACSDSTNTAPVRALAKGVGGTGGNDTSHHTDTTGRRPDSTAHPDTTGHHADSTGQHPDTTSHHDSSGTKPPPPDTGVTHPAATGIYGHVGAPVTISPDSVGIQMVAGITVVAIRVGADSAHPNSPVIAGTTTTDNGGAFSIPKVSDGLYTVRAIPGDGSQYLPAERQGIQVVKGAMVQGSGNQLSLLIGGVWLVLTKKS
jgi:hypothetical protein